ncbi:MAG: hypothetical protein AAB532_03260 [Patescibacteria group bacterium]
MEKEQLDQQPSNINQPLIKSFDNTSSKSKFAPKIVIALVIVTVVGILTGFFLSGSGISGQSLTTKTGGILNLSSAPKGTIVGSDDLETYKDIAEGTLREGGVEGEGAFHLERPGGESKNAYLTSSVVDLSMFVGRKIKVWGQTQKPQRVGWLMDVGRIEVL